MAELQLGFENKLWEMADKLRGNIESSEYKHVILGLVFLKYISDSFTERYEEIKKDYPGMEEDRDAYSSENVFFVPKEARWEFIKSQAKQPTIGQIIDNSMVLIERENASLKNVLPKNYARPELDKTRLGELIDLFSFNVGSKEARAKDVLGRVYEYFLKKYGSTNPFTAKDLWRDVDLPTNRNKPLSVEVDFAVPTYKFRFFSSSIYTSDRNKGRLSIFDMMIFY